MSNKICKKCRGTGHDIGGRPLIEVKEVKCPNGVMRKRHFTKKQGSGCMGCLGIGVVS